jgi:hypothetical protein
MDGTPYDDDPERVREHLRRTTPGAWFVFETVAADGSLALGVARGTPEPTAHLVVYDGLTEPIALAAAEGLARWYRRTGRLPVAEA